MVFGRRSSRASSVASVDRSTLSAATTAASSAFLQSSTSHGNLSSAAAAAALRSHTTSPEPIGNIQTKRMVRRGSNSSQVSTARGGGTAAKPSLQRNNSGGSMTERTFRSPSPGRSPTRSPAEASPVPADAPPVPALPKGINNHRRAASLEPPQRVTSPTPSQRGKSGSAQRASMPPPASNAQAKRLSNVAETEEAERQSNGAGGSVNFSRPRTSQPNSPATPSSTDNSPAVASKQYTHGTGGWFARGKGTTTPSEARPPSRESVRSVKPNRASAPPAPIKAAPQTQDSDDDAEPVMVFDPNSRTFKPQVRARQAQPPSPTVAQQPLRWDPNTRSLVPVQTSAAPLQSPASSRPTTPSQNSPNKKPRPANLNVDTQLEPPPRNPARNSPSSPTSPRGLGILHKQPSVVREDPEGEEEAAALDVPRTRASARGALKSAAPPRSYASPITPVHQRSVSLDVPRQTTVAGRGRNVSISPQRSAHFSPSPVIEATRHDPPPRSISPVKSAMKRSPSSSVRDPSPLTIAGAPPAPPSEAGSDTMSLASQDGPLSGQRKKKTVRVSFDEQPRAIDAVNAAAAPKAIATASSDRSPAGEDDPDEMMQPRPALPSFGSVRRNGRPVGTDVAEKVTETPPERRAHSNDHAIGGIIASSPAATKSVSNDPLPPEVTSKDAAEYVSDESDDFRPDASSTPAKAVQLPDEPGVLADVVPPSSSTAPATVAQLADEEKDAGEPVPAINLLPPTPGLDEGAETFEEPAPAAKPKTSVETFAVPGGWGFNEDSSDDKVVAAPVPSPSVVRAAQVASQTAYTNADEHRSPLVLDAIDEDSDDSAAFSDAAEDLSDLEDGGFASLDAIVASPMSVNAKSSAFKTDAESAPSTSTQAAGEVQPGDWQNATAYWSKLSKAQREQMERAHLSDDDETPAGPVAQPAKKKRVKPAVAAATSAPASTQNAPPAKQSSMRKSMRAEPGPTPVDSNVHMRRSMRPGSSDGMTGRLRDSRQAPTQQQRPQSSYAASTAAQRSAAPPRPVSAGGPPGGRSRGTSDSLPASQDSSFPSFSSSMRGQQGQKPAQPSGGAFTAKLQKQVTNDSDSESSFKKKRRTSVSTVDSRAGRMSMRRSMRSDSMDQAPPMPTAGPTPPARENRTFSLRSLSPNGSFMGRGRGEQLRESLRSGSVDAGPKRTTLRNSQPPPPKTGLFGRSSARPSSSSGAPPAQPRFKSRFGGDSDDDDIDAKPKRGGFRSRFVDSDDDEPSSPRIIAADLTPVRGIPRRQGQYDGDSTDLEDESDDDDPRKASRKREKQPNPMVPDPADVEKAMAAARKKLGIAENNTPAPAVDNKQGSALTKGSLRAPAAATPDVARPQSPDVSPQKKRGFMGSLLRRNRTSTSSVPQITNSAQGSPAPAVPAMTRKDSTGAGSVLATPSSPTPGKLVRRSSQQPSIAGTPTRNPLSRRGDSTFSNNTTLAAAAPSTEDAAKKDDAELANWPLAAGPTLGADPFDRPSTADGIGNKTARPIIGQRSQSAIVNGNGGSPRNHVKINAADADGHDVDADDGAALAGVEAGADPAAGGVVAGGSPASKQSVYSQRTGKKKKFSMLRRAFGLND